MFRVFRGVQGVFFGVCVFFKKISLKKMFFLVLTVFEFF